MPTYPWEARHGLTTAQYQAAFDDLARRGYRLLDVSGYEVAGQERYAAIWEQSPGPPWEARHGLTAAQYQDAFNNFNRQGYRPVRVSGYSISGQPRFAAIWEQSNSGPWDARHNLSAAQYQATFSDLTGQGYRLLDVSGYEVGGQDNYIAIWVKDGGPLWQARHGLSAADYQSAFSALTGQGFRPVRVCGYAIAGQPRFAGIWEQSGGAPWEAHHGLTAAQYQSTFDALARQGFQPRDLSGYGIGGSDFYSAIWEKGGLGQGELTDAEALVSVFMTRYDVPGVSIAITRDGRLVYARGFGLANRATGEPVTPASRFRIASVTKPITSVAIFRLIEQGQLTLETRIFGASGVLSDLPSTAELQQIRVRHLLEHTSGGWPNTPGNQDPMFRADLLGLSQADLIRRVVAEVPLVHAVGTTYAYSNFGYCLLGRVIEAMTGVSYSQFVRQAVLAPCGVTGMELAGNARGESRAGEVVYYGQNGEDPYRLRVDRMDSHGGWIATATDLVRFAVAVDGFATKPDILSSASFVAMGTPTLAGFTYAKGWAVNNLGHRWHDGSLSGTQSLLVRTNTVQANPDSDPGAFCWAALVNTRQPDSAMGGDLDDLMWNIVRRVRVWPNGDLF